MCFYLSISNVSYLVHIPALVMVSGGSHALALNTTSLYCKMMLICRHTIPFQVCSYHSNCWEWREPWQRRPAGSPRARRASLPGLLLVEQGEA